MEEQIQFYSDGLKLSGLIHVQEEWKGEKRPGVIVIHGYTGRKETYVPPYARELLGRGYVVMDFYHRGFGDSEGVPLRNNPEEQVRDILCAVAHLQSRPEIDPDRIGVLGLSHGGCTAIKAAALDENIRCVISIGGPGNGERWMRSKWSYSDWLDFLDRLKEDRVRRVIEGESRRFPYQEISPPGRAEQEAFRKMYRPEDKNPQGYPLENIDYAMAFRAEDFVHRIAPRPVLFIHTERDTMVPLVEAESLYARAGEPKKLLVIPGGSHAEVYEAINPAIFRIAADASLEWLGRHL
ncbi:MAG: alpha/beta fold hydrolase [bacterium]|nr:alpha/beta fold hydrolase [bacterium]